MNSVVAETGPVYEGLDSSRYERQHALKRQVRATGKEELLIFSLETSILTSLDTTQHIYNRNITSITAPASSTVMLLMHNAQEALLFNFILF